MDKMEELLMELSTKMSAMQADIESIKSEIHSNSMRSDENDSSMRALCDERMDWIKGRQDGVKQEIKGQLDIMRNEIDLQNKHIEVLDARIKALEGAEGQKVMKRWGQIKDKVFYAILIAIGYAVIAVLNLNLPAKP